MKILKCCICKKGFTPSRFICNDCSEQFRAMRVVLYYQKINNGEMPTQDTSVFSEYFDKVEKLNWWWWHDKV